MTILEPNQPWPQAYFRRYKYSSGLFGYWEEGYEDESIVDVVARAKDKYYYENLSFLKTLFAGPRARGKISDIIAKSEALKMTVTTKFLDGTINDQRKFLGLDLVFTVDDGLWIA